MTILYIILGLIALLFFSFKVWMWSIDNKEVRQANKIVEQLTSDNTPKLIKEQQLKFLDGTTGWEQIEGILGRKEIEVAVLDYFIDIEPDEYWEHLKINNPSKNILRDMYENILIKRIGNQWEIEFCDHGKKMSSLKFDTYDNMLRFFVFDRFYHIGPNQKKKINKEYYTKYCI